MGGIMGCLLRGRGNEAGVLEQMFEAMSAQSAASPWRYRNATIAGVAPFWNERQDVGIWLHGELFPDPVEINELRACGHKLEPGDSSYLPHLYEEAGPLFFERLNGRFSGVLADLRNETITVFNDRFGLGRIYFVENESGFYFSSAAKSLLRIFPETRQFDERGVAELSVCGCALQNRTLYRGISILPNAAKWTFSVDGVVRKETYFKPSEWEEQTTLDEEEYYHALQDTFAAVLPRYTSTSQAMGMSLTGGIDGRMIMAWAKPKPGALPCYTFGGTYRDSTDVATARRVAQACHQTHSNILIGPEFLALFPKLAEEAILVSDGAIDVTGSVEIFANRKAHEIAPVRLTGSYGSEVLRGNIAFKPQPLCDKLFTGEFVRLGQDAAATYTEEAKVPRQSFIAFKQVPWHHQARLVVEESEIGIRTPFLDNALVRLTFRAPETLLTSSALSMRLIREGNPELAEIQTDRGARYPASFLDKIRAAFEHFRFKAEYVYDYGMPQWLAKVDHALARLRLEKLFLGRHKFYHFRVWYRDALAPYVKEVLLDGQIRQSPFLHGNRLEQMVKDHTTGVANYTSEITQLLSLELIQRQLLTNN